MTQTEHLAKIRAKCVELLDIAEKRTQGTWGIEQTDTANWIGPMRRDGRKIDTIIADTDREGLWPSSLQRNDNNAAFIASCAGPAEAGWRSTIAAIDKVRSQILYGNEEADDFANEISHAIIYAWPEELL